MGSPVSFTLGGASARHPAPTALTAIIAAGAHLKPPSWRRPGLGSELLNGSLAGILLDANPDITLRRTSRSKM